MKTHLFKNHILYISLLSLSIFQACDSSIERIEEWENNNPPVVGENINELIGKSGFDFQTTDQIEVIVNSINPQENSPLPNVGVELYTTLTNGELSRIATGNTGNLANWNSKISIPNDVDSISLKVTTTGYPQWHKISTHQKVVNYTLGSTNTTGRIIQDPIIDSESITPITHKNNLGSRSSYQYLGGFDTQGVPRYLTSPGTVGQNVLEFVAANVPEEFPVPSHNPQYLEDNISSNVIFEEDGELWVSFVHEGAGYRNSIGYFTFDPLNPPTSVDEIDARTILFPNTSFKYSGGGLSTGDRIYLGSFEAGTGVGWFLVPNGWNSRTLSVNESNATRYSIEDLNTFTSPEFRSHALLFSIALTEITISMMQSFLLKLHLLQPLIQTTPLK